jgi:ATP-binding cassette subfamily A (ABC1) protein 3
LRIFGLRTWINNLVWVTRTMCIYFLIIGIVTGLCMVVFPSSGTTQYSVGKAVFNYTDWTVIWTILFVYSIELSTFSVFFGQLFKRRKYLYFIELVLYHICIYTSALLAKFLAFIIWILTFIDFYPGAPVAVRYIMCFFPNTGLMFCLQVMQQYERNSGSLIFYSIIILTSALPLGSMATFGQLYSNLFTYPLYIGICLLLMLIYSVMYMLLAVYIERINPGEFGVAQPWYYIFKQVGCRQKRTSAIVPVDSPQENTSAKISTSDGIVNHWIDLDPVVRDIRPSVSAINLSKVRFAIFSDD